MLNEAQVKDLLEKVLAGKASEEELRMLADTLKRDADYEVTEEMTAFLSKQQAAYALPGEERVTMLADRILEADKLPALSSIPLRPKTTVVALWKKVAVAAAVIVAVAATWFLWPAKKQTAGGELTGTDTNKGADVNPGNNKARLILANGKVVVLDTAANGTLSVQGQALISKCSDGQVSYTSSENAPKEINPAAPLFNTIEVPRGGQYKLILSDGTQVWLNAASSLRFPVTFTGQERMVELEGEGYFEVSPLPAFPGGGGEKKPFIVRTMQADVRVLGTHFNVCAYAGEAWKTTLLEGKVVVKHNNTQSTLMPGNQALLATREENIRIIPDADVFEAIAWKEGYFKFNDAGVGSIMQQLSRWYDVDIVYKDTLNRPRFNGQINRNIRLSGIVNALKQGGINCTIEQNKLLVYP